MTKNEYEKALNAQQRIHEFNEFAFQKAWNTANEIMKNRIDEATKHAWKWGQTNDIRKHQKQQKEEQRG